MEKIENILFENETIIYKAKGTTSKVIINSIILIFAFAMIFYINQERLLSVSTFKLGIFDIILFVFLFIFSLFLIYDAYSSYVKECIITNKRIIAQRGIFYSGFFSIYLNEIQSVERGTYKNPRDSKQGDIKIIAQEGRQKSTFLLVDFDKFKDVFDHTFADFQESIGISREEQKVIFQSRKHTFALVVQFILLFSYIFVISAIILTSIITFYRTPGVVFFIFLATPIFLLFLFIWHPLRVKEILTSNCFITANKIIINHGFLFSDRTELERNKIKSIEVSKNKLGMALGYGTLKIICQDDKVVSFGYLAEADKFKEAFESNANDIFGEPSVSEKTYDGQKNIYKSGKHPDSIIGGFYTPGCYLLVFYALFSILSSFSSLPKRGLAIGFIVVFFFALFDFILRAKESVTSSCMITSQKIVISQGHLSTQKFEIPFPDIKSIEVITKKRDRIYGYGTIKITCSDQKIISFNYLADPYQFKEVFERHIPELAASIKLQNV